MAHSRGNYYIIKSWLGQLWLQIKVLHGGYDLLNRTYPGLVGKDTGCRVVQRKNFPEIIMPGALRNDFYVYLKDAELEKEKFHEGLQRVTRWKSRVIIIQL